MKNKKLKTIIVFVIIILSFCVSAKAEGNEKVVQLGGQTVGVAIYTKGLLITDILAIEDSNGDFVMPANLAGLKKGDYILKANNVELKDISNLDAVVSSSNGNKIDLVFLRENREENTSITPIKSKNDSKLRLGLMIRDSAAGIGTITFSDNSKFMALGHAINDFDTGTAISVEKGRIVKCNITGVQKSEVQKPGELKGNFGVNAEILGKVNNNTQFGIVGEKNGNLLSGQNISVADSKSVSVGKATVYSDFEGEGLKGYSAEITKINDFNDNTTRSFMIKITDSGLIDKTGGIVQGLSGSPIVQNGKLVGAVTHVLLSDPTKGYGIFINNMLKMCA